MRQVHPASGTNMVTIERMDGQAALASRRGRSIDAEDGRTSTPSRKRDKDWRDAGGLSIGLAWSNGS
jgi:hypothetical protein